MPKADRHRIWKMVQTVRYGQWDKAVELAAYTPHSQRGRARDIRDGSPVRCDPDEVRGEEGEWVCGPWLIEVT